MDVVGLFGHGGDGVSLYGVAYAEGGQCREHCEEHGQPLPAQSAFQGVHRSAEHASAFGLHPILDGQQSFGVLRRDAEDARQPAPQNGARAAEGNGRSHADDVARADGGG